MACAVSPRAGRGWPGWVEVGRVLSRWVESATVSGIGADTVSYASCLVFRSCVRRYRGGSRIASVFRPDVCHD